MARQDLKCKCYPCGTLKNMKYVVVCSFYQGKIMLSRHKQRNTWETQGGHIEEGETALAAAKRELYEESGVENADFYPVCDYLGYDQTGSAEGAVFLAVVHQMGTLPDSEMKEAALFSVLPENLTYPMVTPELMKWAKELLDSL